MRTTSPQLPGKLGDPNLTIASDPRLDPRLAEAAAGLSEALEELPVAADSPLAEIRTFVLAVEAEVEVAYAEFFRDLPAVPGVERRSEAIEGASGNEIPLFIHAPAKRDGRLPCILHIHGGGMVMCAAADAQYVRWRDELAATGLVVVGVEFRNGAGKLGDHPFPAGLEDCASATRWAYAQRDTLGISHIVTSGESGGGNLCLATALEARREGWLAEIAGVYSCCPYISGTYNPPPPELGSAHENAGYLLNAIMMQALVRAYDPEGQHATDPRAWPYHARRSDLTGLPPHVISVNELDPLRDEGLIYARKLLAAAVPTVSRTVNGTTHAGDMECVRDAPDIYYATIRDIHGFAGSLAR